MVGGNNNQGSVSAPWHFDLMETPTKGLLTTSASQGGACSANCRAKTPRRRHLVVHPCDLGGKDNIQVGRLQNQERMESATFQ